MLRVVRTAGIAVSMVAVAGVIAMDPPSLTSSTPDAAAQEPTFVVDPIPPGGLMPSPQLTLREVVDATRVPGLPDTAITGSRDRVRVGAANSNGIPALSSRPGANITIFLDFDGFTLDGTTGWNKYMGLPAMQVPPFDTDGDPNSFSNRELDGIASTWAYVSEDYSPWDVNVTTVDPGLDALVNNGNGDTKVGIRVGFAPPDGELHQLACNTGCTGKAYTGVFASMWAGQRIGVGDTPALVFTTDTYTTASHEVGHALGLLHHGTTDSEYFFGHGKWSPVMGGTDMSRTVTQWSKGEYQNANKSSQDDIRQIRNILPTVFDDHSSIASGGTTIQPGDTIQGLIGVTSGEGPDRDTFRITVTEPTWIQAAPRWSKGANNLDIKMTISDATSFRNVAVIDPPNPNGDLPGMSASTTLQPGTWVITIEGTGHGSPYSGGYSDYGSIGTYTLTTSGSSPSPLKINGPGLWAVPVNSSAPTFPFTAQGGVAPYTWDVPTGLPGELELSPSGVLSGWTPGAIARWAITIAVTDSGGQRTEFNATISTADDKSGPGRESLTVTVPDTINVATGQKVKETIKITGGAGPYRIRTYDLPPGLEITQDRDGDVTLAGTPSRKGSWKPQLTVTDADGNSVDASFTVLVAGDPSSPVTVSFSGKRTVKVGANVRVTVYVSGGSSPEVVTPAVGQRITGARAFTFKRHTPGDTASRIAFQVTGKASSKGTFPVAITVQDGSRTVKAITYIKVR